MIEQVMPRDVTAEEVKEAVLAAGVDSIPRHRCAVCNVLVKYYVYDGDLYFDPSCACTRTGHGAEKRDWEEAADWVNMQTNPQAKLQVARKLYMEL